MHEYDIALKGVLRRLHRQGSLTGFTVTRWHDAELPAARRQFGQFSQQVALYVGKANMQLKSELKGPHRAFQRRIVDIRELDGRKDPRARAKAHALRSIAGHTANVSKQLDARILAELMSAKTI